MAPKPKKPSGRNVSENKRGTVAVKLRLPPDVADRLHELAARRRVTVSGLVAELIPE